MIAGVCPKLEELVSPKYNIYIYITYIYIYIYI